MAKEGNKGDPGDKDSGVVRLATREDIPAILEIINQNLDRLLPRQVREVEELLGTIWVLEKDGSVEGTCTLEVYSPKIAEIRTVVIRERSRGLGYGKRLVEVATKEAERRKVKEIIVVTSSKEFFEQLGFGECLNERYVLFWKGKSD